MKNCSVRCCCLAFCLIFICATLVSSAPTYNDYNGLRDLFELLLRREALAEKLNRQHQVTKRLDGAPSLRLRFGKRHEDNPYTDVYDFPPPYSLVDK